MMPTPKDNLYTSYEFSEEESFLAFIFTEMQFKHIQSTLAAYANDKAALSYNPDLPNSDDRYIRQSEYLRGAMEAIGFLLTTHEDTKDRLLQSIKDTQMYGQANQSKGN